MNSSRLYSVILAAVLWIAAPAAGIAQTVSGVIADSSDVGLQGATVVLLARADSALVKFAVTGGDGAFEIRRVADGDYVLQVTFVGFETDSRNISIDGEDLALGTIRLAERTTELGELVVNADHVPMMISGDTLDFNAAAFGAPPNSSVEDLLRRIPGIEVEEDGSIRAQGEDVQNVLVDGKEFFGDDPKTATRNLPADAVDRVQVYDRQSDRAEFSGIDDGQRERTINLGLKEEARQGQFGNVSGAYGGLGDDHRYEGTASINRFSPTTQLSFIGNANNINATSSEFSSFGGARFVVFGPGGGNFGGGGNGITETLTGGLNFNHDFSDRTELRSSYRLSSRENSTIGSLSQQQLLGSSRSSLVEEFNDNFSDEMNHQFNLNLDHELSDNQRIRFRGDLRLGFADESQSRVRDTFAADGVQSIASETLYSEDGNSQSGDASLTYRNRLNERGTTLVAQGSVDLNNSEQDATLNSADTYMERDADDLVLTNQFQRDVGDQFENRQELSLSHPIFRAGQIEVSTERRAVSENQEKSIYDITDGERVFNPVLSSGFERTYSYLLGGTRYNRTTESTSFNVGAEVQTSTLEGDIRGRDETISRSYTHVLPSANLRHTIKEGMRIGLNYRTSTREPSMRELQPFTDNTDPQNVYVGNPNLKPEYTHALSVNLTYFDAFTFRNVFTFLRFTYTEDNITSSRTIEDNFSQTRTSVNAGEEWSAMGHVNVGTPINPLRATLRLSDNLNYSRGTELINGDENETRTIRNTVGVRLENRYKDRFDISANADFTFNVNEYSLNPQLDQSYVNASYRGSGTVYIRDVWQVGAELDYRVYSQEVFGEAQNVPSLNASVTRYLMDNRVEVELVGQDLLDESLGISYTNTSNYVQRSEYNAIGRYIMLRFRYNLSPVRR
ncbi:MAG: TonB-dependent receptor [Rhodothermales bacterium]|nr:TonB-dependent receptor [Rhodothermales bacterium]